MVDKSRKFISFVRLGYAARGLTYLLLGYIAFATAGDARGGAASVYDWLQAVPLGWVLLWVMALGLLAYAGFKFLSAAGDIQHRGSDALGIAERVGDAASGAAHVTLAYAAAQFAIGARTSVQGNTSQEVVHSILSFQFGSLLIGIAGLGFLTAAAMQAKKAYTAGFMHHVAARAPGWIRPIGRAGHAARAVVFGLIGWSLVQSAWLDRSDKVDGLGGALLALRGSGGAYLLVALGLSLFGLFSLFVARYRIIPDFDGAGLVPKFRS